MSSYNPLISKIHKSRNIILKILEKRGFNVDDWTGFSINEIQTLYNNKQLDILVAKDDKKIYVKYHLDTRLGYSHIYEYIDDLFDVEEVLTDDDELIIISRIQSAKGVRIHITCEVYRKEVLLARGYTCHACTDTNGKPCRLPESIKRLVASG